jgi:small subunit ribosomal protein S20
VPNIKSAKKRVLVNEKKNNENRIQISAVKTAIKKINYAIDTNNMEEAERLLPETYAILDKAVTKGLLHKNTAANKKSGIAKRIADIKAGKKEVVIKKDNKTIAAEKAKAAQEAREAKRAEIAQKNAEKKAAQEAAKAAAAAEEKKAAKKTTAKKTTTKKAKKDAE